MLITYYFSLPQHTHSVCTMNSVKLNVFFSFQDVGCSDNRGARAGGGLQSAAVLQTE